MQGWIPPRNGKRLAASPAVAWVREEEIPEMLHGSRTTRCNDRNVYRVRYPAGYIQCKPVFRSVMIHGCEQYLTGPQGFSLFDPVCGF